MPKRLLVVYHSLSGNTAAMAEAVFRGARRESAVETRIVRAADAGLSDLFEAHAYCFGTPANFGYMAGALKDFFDRSFEPTGGRLQGRSYAAFVSCDDDATGALNSVQRIAQGFGLRPVADPVVATAKRVTRDDVLACEELGQALAAGLDLGIF